MTSIDQRVTGLNPDTYQAIQSLQTRNGRLSQRDLHQLTETLLKDGQIDAAEADLLQELSAYTGELNVHISELTEAGFEPRSFQFGEASASGRQLQIPEDVQQELAEMGALAQTKAGQLELVADKHQTAYGDQKSHYTEILQEAAETHPSATLGALSTVLDIGRGDTALQTLVVDILARKGEHLNADDYDALSRMLGNDSLYSAHRDIEQAFDAAVGRGNRHAIEALKRVALDPQNYRARDAAEILQNHPRQLDDDDRAALIPLMGRGYAGERISEALLEDANRGNVAVREALQNQATAVPEDPREIRWLAREDAGIALTRLDRPTRDDYPGMVSALGDRRWGTAARERILGAVRSGQAPEAILDQLVLASQSVDSSAPRAEARAVLLSLGTDHLRPGDYKELIGFLAQDNESSRQAEALLRAQVQAGNSQVIEALQSEVTDYPTYDGQRLRSQKAEALLEYASASLSPESQQALDNGELSQLLSQLKDEDKPGQKAIVERLLAGDEALKTHMLDSLTARPVGRQAQQAYRQTLRLLTQAGLGGELSEAAVDHLRSAIRAERPGYEVSLMPGLLMQYAQANPPQTALQSELSETLEGRSGHGTHLSLLAEATVDAFLAHPEQLTTQDKDRLAAAGEDLFRAHDTFLREGSRPEVLRTLGDIAQLTGSASLKSQLLATLPTSPLSQSDIDASTRALQQNIERTLSRAMSDKDNTSDTAQYGRYLKALSIYNSPNTPQAMKDQIDIAKIQQEIERLGQSPEVLATFESAREQAIEQQFYRYGSRAGNENPADALKTHLLSESFRQQMRLMEPEAAKALASEELQKLAFLDPAGAQEVMQELMLQEVEANSGEALGNLDVNERQSALTQVLSTFETVMEGADRGAKVADKVATVIAEMDAERLKALADQPDQLAQAIQERLGNDTRAKNFVLKLQQRGALGSVMGMASLVSMGAKWPPENPEQSLGFLADGLGAASNAGDAARLLRLASRSAIEGSRTFRFTSKVLGPVGDALSVGLNTYGSYRDFSDGDYVGGSAKAVGALSAGAGLGVAVLATNPAGWVVLACVGVGVAAWGVDSLWGHDDSEAAFLRSLDLL